MNKYLMELILMLENILFLLKVKCACISFVQLVYFLEHLIWFIVVDVINVFKDLIIIVYG